MPQNDGVGNFSRQDLRAYNKFVEGDFRGINPRRFYRELKREVEEIQHGGGFKYTTKGDQRTDLSISSEEVGSKTGTITGRMKAQSGWEDVGTGRLTYRPYAHYGVLAGVIGFLFLSAGLVDSIWLVPAVGLFVAAYYAYSQEEQDEYSVIQRNEICVLMTGEVSEREVNEDGRSRTDMFADMSVVFAAESMNAFEIESLEEKPKQFRAEYVEKVKEAYNSGVDDPDHEIPVDNTGIIRHLDRFTQNTEKHHRSELSDVQDRVLNSTLEFRREFSDSVREGLPADTRSELDEQEELLLVELQDLADNLDIYVEREGLEHKQNLSQRAGGNRELGE